jgi:hypothetical protein
MNKIYTIFALLLTSSLLIGQITIEADVNPSFEEGPQNEFEIVAKVMVTNNSANTSTFTWLRNEDNLVEGWTSSVCDKTMCWFASVSSKSFELTPGESSILDLHVNPLDICGEGYGLITLTDDNDPTNSIEIRYDITSNTLDGSECSFTSSVNNFKLDFVQLYPNPASDFFTLTDTPSDLEFIHVYNILGKNVMTFNAMEGDRYYINDLSKGLYLVNLTNAKGENLNTIKLHKN